MKTQIKAGVKKTRNYNGLLSLPVFLGLLLSFSSLRAQDEQVEVEVEAKTAKCVDSSVDSAAPTSGLKFYWANLKKLVKRNPDRPKPVKRSEVKVWKPMGHRYVAGYDDKGNILMIGDMSYPNLFSRKHMPRSLLGMLGVGHLNAQTAVGFIASKVNHHQEKEKTTALETFMDEETPEWKLSGKGGADKFTLADVDLEKMSGQSLEKFNKLMKKAGYENFLEGIQLEKNSQGSYDIYFLDKTENDLPEKVVDFRAYKSSFKKAGYILAAMTILKTAVSSIPLPVFKNIASAFLERWLWLFETQYLGHHAQVLQLLDDAYHGDKDSPFSSLSKEDLEKALRYVHNANTMWSNLLAKLVLGRKNPWERKEKLFDKKIKRSKEWAEEEKVELVPFHRYFAYGLDKEGIPHKIFVLPHSVMFRKKPITAVDYRHPRKEIFLRTHKEAVMQGVNYLDVVIPVPVVPAVVQILNNAFVNDEVVRRKNWEARLAAWMLNQEDIQNHKAWEQEIEMLYSRRMNPFELSREEEEKLIRQRQLQLKISP